MENLSFEQLVISKFEGLSQGQKKVAEYILQNLEKCSYDTLAKISRETQLSETTVIRLSYALGFSSFSEMQSKIRSQILNSASKQAEDDKLEQLPLEQQQYADIIEKDIQNLRQTLNQLNVADLNTAIDRIIRADQVIVIGSRTSFAAAHWFSFVLGYMRDRVKLVAPGSDIFEYLLGITERTVVVTISFPRFMKETIRFVETAKKEGAYCIGVTDSPVSLVGRLSDTVLLTYTNRDETGMNAISAVISLLNLIVTGVRRHDPEQVKKRLQKLEGLYSEHDVLIE